MGGFIVSSPNLNAKRDLSKNPRVNEEILASSLRLIGADGKQIGIVKLNEALRIAEEEGLDLVEIAPSANPPVCKIIDYGKYRYELTKKERDARKKQHIVQVKKIRLTPNIDENDFQVKIAAARRFIAEGNRVKITLFMRGRQVTKQDIAEEVISRVVNELSDIGKTEGTPKMEGINNLSVTLVKKK